MEKKQKLAEIEELLNSGTITESEYNKLKNELGHIDENTSDAVEIVDLSPFDKKIITQIKNAGNSLKGVYVSIILQIINGFIYGLLIGFKTSLLNESNVDSTISFIHGCQIVFGVIELVLFIRMLIDIKQAALSLINVCDTSEDEDSFAALIIIAISFLAIIGCIIWYKVIHN